MKISLIYRGQTLQSEISEHAKGAELSKTFLATVPGISSVKLLFKGRAIKDDDSLASLGLQDGAKVMVLASTAAEVAAITAPHPTARVRDDLSVTAAGTGSHSQRNARRRRPQPDPSYGFGEIRVLEGFSDKQTARRLLKRIANDPGVLSVMKVRYLLTG
jgi:hypothetical protein